MCKLHDSKLPIKKKEFPKDDSYETFKSILTKHYCLALSSQDAGPANIYHIDLRFLKIMICQFELIAYNIQFHHHMFLIPLALIFGAYAIFSILLFFFPTILHKPAWYKNNLFNHAIHTGKILRITHRGGPRYTTENTIQAFKKALPVCDMLEMDVCETKDGILVVHHDHDLERTCGVQKFIRDVNFKELPSFKEEIELNFAPEGRTVKSNGQSIPTLEEVFKTFPDTPMNIEVKTPSVSAVKSLIRLINTYERRNITILGIRGKMQNELRFEDVNSLRFINDSQFGFLAIAYFTGLLPFIYVQQATLQLPLFTEQFYQWKQRQWGSNWKTNFFFKGIKVINFIFRPFIYHLRKRGIMTYYWVCNTEQSFQRAIRCGACGIMTDDPFLLDDYLKKREGNNQNDLLVQNDKKEV